MSGPDQPFLPEGDVYTARDWRSYVNQEPPVQPSLLSVDEYQALDDAARAAYNERRRIHIMHLGVLPTPDLERIHDRLWAQFQSNLRLPGHGVKVGAVLDGDAGLGKTTIARTFAREVEKHLMKVTTFDTPGDRNRFIPVVHLTLNKLTTFRDLAEAICGYLDIILMGRPSVQQLLEIVCEAVRNHSVMLLVVNDIHFLGQRTQQTVDMVNYLKTLMNLTGATFLFVGIDCERFGFFRNPDHGTSLISQTASRFMYETVRPYARADISWNRLIVILESHLVLLKHEPGTLASLDAYLLERTNGNIGSLMRLVRKAVFGAIGTTERLDRAVLDQTQLDYQGP